MVLVYTLLDIRSYPYRQEASGLLYYNIKDQNIIFRALQESFVYKRHHYNILADYYTISLLTHNNLLKKISYNMKNWRWSTNEIQFGLLYNRFTRHLTIRLPTETTPHTYVDTVYTTTDKGGILKIAEGVNRLGQPFSQFVVPSLNSSPNYVSENEITEVFRPKLYSILEVTVRNIIIKQQMLAWCQGETINQPNCYSLTHQHTTTTLDTLCKALGTNRIELLSLYWNNPQSFHQHTQEILLNIAASYDHRTLRQVLDHYISQIDKESDPTS